MAPGPIQMLLKQQKREHNAEPTPEEQQQEQAAQQKASKWSRPLFSNSNCRTSSW
jgi:hypothetical protein